MSPFKHSRSQKGGEKKKNRPAKRGKCEAVFSTQNPLRGGLYARGKGTGGVGKERITKGGNEGKKQGSSKGTTSMCKGKSRKKRKGEDSSEGKLMCQRSILSLSAKVHYRFKGGGGGGTAVKKHRKRGVKTGTRSLLL